MENRHDLVVDCRVTLADGYGERDAAQEMASDRHGAHQKTIGADKNIDAQVRPSRSEVVATAGGGRVLVVSATCPTSAFWQKHCGHWFLFSSAPSPHATAGFTGR
jgi:hypothetical protein